MGKITVYFVPLVCIILISNLIHAQNENWEEDGAIEDAEVVIEKDRQITLEKADRGYEKVSPLPVSVDQGPQSYSFNVIDYTATPFTPNIRINKIKEQPLPKLYGNYVKGGVGNYGTTYLEGYFNNKRNETYAIGGYFKSLNATRGPVDKGNSASSNFTIGFDGDYFSEKMKYNGAVGYQRDKLFYYGYTPGTEVDKDTIKQVYTRVNIGLGMEDRKKNQGVDFTFDVNYTSFGDNFQVNEDQGAFNFYGDYAINDLFTVALKSDLYLTKRSIANLSQNRNFFRIRPTVKTEISLIDFEIGVNIVSENDTITNANKVHIAPFATATLNLSDNLSFYAGISGDVDYRSLSSYVDENPYLGSDLTLSHNIKTFEVLGGLKGSLWDDVTVHAGLSIGTYDNLAFYAASSKDSTRYDILYDTDNPTLVHFFGEFEYSNTSQLILNFRGDLYGYNTKTLVNPWGRPTFSLKASGSYNVYGKLLLGSSLNILGGIKALNQQSGNTQSLDTILDINVSADYLFSPRFSAFVIGKNLISRNYQQFLYYPSRGISVIAGITYSF